MQKSTEAILQNPVGRDSSMDIKQVLTRTLTTLLAAGTAWVVSLGLLALLAPSNASENPWFVSLVAFGPTLAAIAGAKMWIDRGYQLGRSE